MDGKAPDFLPRLTPHLFKGTQHSTKGRRRIRISRSSPLRGQGFPVGEIQVQIVEDSDDDPKTCNSNADIPPSPPSASYKARFPQPPPPECYFPMPDPATHPRSEAYASIVALYKQDGAWAATTAFEAHRRAKPADAVALIGTLILAEPDAQLLAIVLFWHLFWRDHGALCDLAERAVRWRLGMSQLPRPAFPSLSFAYLHNVLLLQVVYLALTSIHSS